MHHSKSLYKQPSGPSQRLFGTLQSKRALSASSVLRGRAVVFSGNGNPWDVLTSVTFPRLPKPPPHSVNVKLLLSPINPADVNVIQGVYPSQPTPTLLSTPSRERSENSIFIGGNEGLAEITQIGEGILDLREGDWVVLAKPQRGAWSSNMNLPVADVLRISKSDLRCNEVIGATLTVNPPTAYNMLHDFVHLEDGDWLLQNGANSAVGQAVIQIAASMGVRTINFLRDRDDLTGVTRELQELGATHVLTYDTLANEATRNQVQEWTGGKPIRLGLNCIGGRDTMFMARLLGQDAHLVSYGAMSKQPLSLSTSQLIFKNLKCYGFWQTRWYNDHDRTQREKLMDKLVALVQCGKLREPKHEIVGIDAHLTDDEATAVVRNAVKRAAEGRCGKKVLLRIEDPLIPA